MKHFDIWEEASHYEVLTKISQPKEWKLLFEPNLDITTQEEHLRKLGELFHLFEAKAQLCKSFDTEDCTSNDVFTDRLHDPDLSVMVVGHVAP